MVNISRLQPMARNNTPSPAPTAESESLDMKFGMDDAHAPTQGWAVFETPVGLGFVASNSINTSWIDRAIPPLLRDSAQ